MKSLVDRIMDKHDKDLLLKLEWKVIQFNGVDTNYEVSTHGDVKNIHTQKILNKRINKWGYEDLNICIDGVQHKMIVHRLVAIAFIPNPENKPTVNHEDGNKVKNEVSNLSWATYKEQVDHAIKMGLLTNDGINNVNSIYTEEQIHRVCEMLEDISTNVSSISNETLVSTSIIYDIASGRRWKRISSQYNIPNKRFKLGEFNHNNLFTTQQIRYVCKMIEDPKNKAEDISKASGVSISTVHDITNGKSWTHIAKDYKFPEKRSPSRNKPPSEKTLKVIEWIKSGMDIISIMDRLRIEFDMPDQTKSRQCVNDVKRMYNLELCSTTIPNTMLVEKDPGNGKEEVHPQANGGPLEEPKVG